MSQYLAIQPSPAFSSSTTPPLKPNFFPPPFCSDGFPSPSSSFLSPSPFISISCACASQTPPPLPLHDELQQNDDAVNSSFLAPISSDAHFDRVLADSHRLHQPLLIVWIASWCRKCIYLKPKLEKLAAEYFPRLRFYSVDVNTISHKLVARAGVTKMPTIQLWKDSNKQAEVIGGHKPYLVINEVREMIENECSESLEQRTDFPLF